MRNPNNWQKILALFAGDMNKIVTAKEIRCLFGNGKTHSWYIENPDMWSYMGLDGQEVSVSNKKGLSYGYIERVGRGKYKITEKGLNYKK
jgi:predicted transcriptional regulator of viral defense system